ncbi:signal recognition particle-docking protein FtsY [Bordetella bronchiseptica]|nr:signal recognition particle-docking protein FtsY [Bordetella bronchiseptica]KDB79732.1 signal recognition particle-docking protein FtsY [Bordetella bronchiseptica CARE970018BB]KDC35830.1 signal recognition particle-docking protein FtsY [Bordetella bronchiseptica M435/02/3]KDC46106.1 signal recognition particle-docking protein FtsY [Bordetella bronchiseptica M85/00/2]KDC98408.1 signal recognition particle-docking protein FtsY [Bordetella bronchiseptica MBORD670]KDD21759.1 signal recognition 
MPMFSFFKKKSPPPAAPAQPAPPPEAVDAGSAAPAQPQPAEPQPAPMPAPQPEPQPEPQPQQPPEPAPPAMASPPVAEPQPSVAEPQPPVAAAPEAPRKASWLSRLKQGLSRTGQNIGGLFVGVKVDENLFEELESALIMADAGIEATEKLLAALRARVKKERIDDPAQVKTALRQLLADHLRPLERSFDLGRAQPLVVMIAGVNGAGKTTSIGKLAHTFQRQGASVLLAAGDTFRAAAREQLVEWGSRNNVTVISQDGGDPAAVAFDSVNAGRARNVGVVMVDTAGRLPTQLHLMEELKKIRRVIGKAEASAPHEVLLVVDGNTGQNALAQIRAFDAAITLTGLVVTKLDGTAKGGTLAAVAAGSQGVRPIPVYWIGVGEGLEDLQPFVADEFAAALLAD